MNGWTESAEAWIASQGDEGDPSRRFVTDPAVRMLLAGRRFSHMLDVGCGEGRFCRLMKPQCARTTGIDPTVPLIDAARRLDPDGDYVIAGGEALPFADAAFDLVASYLSLGDIPDYRAAISEMARVLAPGGTLLVVNVTAFNSAGAGLRWERDLLGRKTAYRFDRYMDERADWEDWKGIRILNYHRPLSAYMQAFLSAGLTLRHFDEPLPQGADPDWTLDFARAPLFVVMAWQKPA
ncbi:MAG: class I SAM-dependent methyltransferase [Hyphomonas sp.]|nr:class I SAM-dependent methyltransferase [Hyphomonas sp.]MCB9963240.1 class I SAM-dependent methyltransferase [Hyphomonas sp.]MCB9970153.1 class I SAM-dependent methyltransferase [Hyphomonas sp.]